ncbi:imelysin family protein [Hydrogenophaga sp.]|uniref:imelysin family protein n=1 Tax=Hydrogenophaga sp. TaxID=1904254 RepID=UPI0025C610D0|nr:imelysin family protein [Hydrogenophaga sp.]MBT9467312.1 imelysin family protein [Hydrogenophaga sp.]
MIKLYRFMAGVGMCLAGGHAHAQSAEPVVAFPIYNAAQAMQGLHQHTLLPRAQAFADAAQALTRQTTAHCASPAGGDGALQAARQQWQGTLQAWEAFSSVATGAVLERRSQRQIDFWPVRPTLIERAIARAPQGEKAMELVGTPAKGLPALEWLLWTRPAAPATAACAFAQEVARDVEREALALVQAEASIAAKDWDDDAEASGQGMAEWINQWLGGLESLRWAQMEKPLKAAPAGERPAYARLASRGDAASWQTQWRTLREHAGVTPEQRRAPPRPGEALAPIEAILMGQGKLALSAKWSTALAQADQAMAVVDPARAATVLSASTALKSLSLLFQNEVASSLDIPLGFSSADGD